MLMLFCVPILGNTLGNETTYSEVLLDGEVIGAVADPRGSGSGILECQSKDRQRDEGLVLANVECSFQRVSKLFGSTLKEEQLEQVIYDLLQEKVKTAKQKYYMVKVNEFTINLASMDEVQQLLEAALMANDPDGLFQVQVVSDTSRELKRIYSAGDTEGRDCGR